MKVSKICKTYLGIGAVVSAASILICKSVRPVSWKNTSFEDRVKIAIELTLEWPKMVWAIVKNIPESWKLATEMYKTTEESINESES